MHKNEASEKLAVIGILFNEGNENALLQKFIDHLPPVENNRYSSEEKLNVNDMLPTDHGFYTYSGSLTTPPCSEDVRWLVMKTPVEASGQQIQKIHDLVHNNYRRVQPLNGREIEGSP